MLTPEALDECHIRVMALVGALNDGKSHAAILGLVE